MANLPFTPRLPLAPLQLQGHSGSVPHVAGKIRESLDLIRSEPGRLEQTRYSLLDMKYRSIAFDLYVVGYPLKDVRDAFAGLALAGLKVVQLRGTEDPILKVVVTLDNRYPPGDPRHASEAPAHPPGTKDYSVGNSSDNFLYVTAALASGEFDLARSIAALAWEPPDADWIGPRSFCTPNDVRIATAVKHLFAGERDAALAELTRVRPNKWELESKDQEGVAGMLRALARDDANAFIVALNGSLRWHEHAFKQQWNLDFYLSLPGTGLSALALHRGLIARDDLDDDSPYLPLGLIDLALDRARAGSAPEFRVFEPSEFGA